MASDTLPPSYQTFLESVSAKSSIAEVQAAIDKLPLHTGVAAFEAPPAYTPQQSVTVNAQIANTLASNEGQNLIKQNTKAATDAIKSTEDMFISLKSSLQQIDQQYTSPKDGAFAPRLQTIHDKWRGVVQQSKDLATSISVYIKTFSDNYVTMINDPNTTKDKKVERLDKYIKEADGFATSSGNITAEFIGVQNTFGTLKNSFSTWATEKSEHLNTQLKKAEDELAELKIQLAKKEGALLGVGIGAGLSLPVTGMAAVCAGPFAPAVIVIGILAATALSVAAIVLAVQVSNLKDNVKSKLAEVDGLKSQIKEIDDARKELIALGNKNFELLRGNIGAITAFWNFTKQDAIAVRDTLKKVDGYVKDNWPEAAGKDSESAIKLYNAMALYLEAYAKGISI